MATKTFTVATYEVALSRQMTIGAGVAKFYAYIVCRSTQGDRFAIYFLRPDSSTPDNVYTPSANWATCYLPAEQFAWYLNLLRNERPVSATVDSVNPIANRLFTGTEAVGEEET